MNAVEIDKVSKTFRGKRGSRVEALRGLTLAIAPGEVFGFLGPNGAGKSTTIKIIMGLITATSGSARIMGHDIASGAARRSVGYLPENPAFYDYLSAEEYLRFVGATFSMPADLLEERLRDTLRLVDLWDARKRPMRGYSKGMVQRVGLAQVLIHDPEVFILDEPMSGLDPLGRALVKEIILDQKRRGKTVFFSTHIIADVETVCDRVGVIVKGELVALDAVENILRSGVEGYLVQLRLRDGQHGQLHGFEPVRTTLPLVEYYVGKNDFNRFMAEVASLGIEVTLVETRRRDLEDFFLSLVQGA